MAVVPRKGHFSDRGVGSLRRNASRQGVQVGKRPGGLHFKSNTFRAYYFHAQRFHHPPGGHVRKSGKFEIPFVLHQVASLPGAQGRCSQVPHARSKGSVCKPTLEGHPTVAASSENEPQCNLFTGGPLLGFCNMVAPVNKVGKTRVQVSSFSTSERDVQQLLGRVYAEAQMAPGLSDCIRKILEKQQVQSEDIDLYLGGLKSLKRYDLPFRKLWALMTLKGLLQEEPTVHNVALGLAALNSISQNEARNAYSACLLLPGF